MPRLVRFLIWYASGGKKYWTCLPGISAAHIRRNWNRPGSTFLSASECDENHTEK